MLFKKIIFYLSKTATSGTFRKIGDTLRNHPENALDKLDNANDLIINHKKVLADVRENFNCSIVDFITVLFILMI